MKTEGGQQQQPAGSWLSATAILTNSIIGSGILGLPYAFTSTGFVLGSVLLLASALVTVLNLHLLAKCGLKTQQQPLTLYSVVSTTFPQSAYVVDMTVSLHCLLSGMGYLITIGGLMPDVLREAGIGGVWAERRLWVLLGFGVVAPLAFARSLNSLRFTTYFAFLCIVFIAGLAIAYALPTSVTHLDPCPGLDSIACSGSTPAIIISLSVLRVFSIFTNGYTCQQNIFTVMRTLPNPTISRLNTVIVTAVATTTVLFLAVSLAAYHTYGGKLLSNFLENYPKTSILSLARILVSLQIAFSYPLQCHPCREALLTLLRLVERRFCWDKHVEGSSPVAGTTASLHNKNSARQRSGSHSASPSLEMSRTGSFVYSPVQVDAEEEEHACSAKKTEPQDSVERLEPGLSRAYTSTSTSSTVSSGDNDMVVVELNEYFNPTEEDSRNPVNATTAIRKDSFEFLRRYFTVSFLLRFRYELVTMVYLSVTLTVALLLSDLGLIFELKGATSGTIIAFILPGLCYYRMHRMEESNFTLFAAYGLFVVGLILIPLCVAFVFI